MNKLKCEISGNREILDYNGTDIKYLNKKIDFIINIL